MEIFDIVCQVIGKILSLGLIVYLFYVVFNYTKRVKDLEQKMEDKNE